MADLAAGDLEEIVRLRAIACVSGPSVLDYVRAVTRSVGVLPQVGPPVVWLDAKAPGDRTAVVAGLYSALGLENVHGARPRRRVDTEDMIVAGLSRTPRLVVVLGAHELRTVSLEMLYGMWAHQVPGHFPLILTGLSGKLERVVDHPALASLKSCVFLHHCASTPA
ncbi:hypothetical protein [Streptomyces sp. NPDC001205]